MKISFPNYGSGALISIRAAINAWLNGHKAERAQTVARKENVQITAGWDYRPRKPIRPPAFSGQPKPEPPDALNPDRFGTNNLNHVWRNDTSPERAAPSFINGGLNAEELMSEVLSETTNPVCTTTAVNHAAVSGYD